MKNSLKQLFKMRQIYIGIGAAIAFQLIFFTVWLTAYDGVENRTKQLQVGVVSDDSVLGEEMLNQMKSHLPFELIAYSTLEQAKDKMEEQKVSMIIYVPNNFTESITSGDKAEITYYINQSSATFSKSLMEKVALQVNDEMNKELFGVQKQKIVSALETQFQQTQIPEEILKQIHLPIKGAFLSLEDQSVEAVVTKVNDVDGFSANLVPLMVIIASFVGAMVMVMQHEEAAQLVRENASKWPLFFTRQLINVVVSIILPILTLGLMGLFNVVSDVNIVTVYFFQVVMFLAFLSFAQVFVLAFGNIGMVFNILALSLQLVTSGVFVPRDVLSTFYGKVATILPATYGADGYFTIIFGGHASSMKENIVSLGLIIAICFILSTSLVGLYKYREKNTSKKDTYVNEVQV